MAFFQDPPRLGNQYDDDPLLREWLDRNLPEEARRATEGELRELGERAGGELYQMQLADRLNDPVLTPYDPWGNRIDHIEVSPLWKVAQRIAAEHGLVATAYESVLGEHARAVQFALNYVVQASLDVYSCPLAMTDGAARSLLDSGNQALIDRALPRLTSRDPERMWTSGQWMTERTGGSDVGASETVARQADGEWRLYGTKWFTSATTAEMALTLGRPDGNGPGGKGLAMFYVETRDDQGYLRGITVNRLKDKLGTRKVPTAELTLDGLPAIPVAGLSDGVKKITPMLNITRTWNAVMAASGMRRAIALALDFSRRRPAFGALLAHKPLHGDTLATIIAEAEAAFHLAFHAVQMIGRREAGAASERDELLVRALTPITKLTTGKQAVAIASEAIESFGGAGYVEDTGLPRLMADAQVLPIWEGTTNVLSLDTLRALTADGAFDAVVADARERIAGAAGPLTAPAHAVDRALTRAGEWLAANMSDRARLEAGARRFAMTLGRSLELALMVEHAGWCATSGRGDRAAAAARRFAISGVDCLADVSAEDVALLTGF